jgi:hypothetical protein
MKKLILTLAILFALQPLVASASLYSYYQELGSKLPTIAERAVLYSEIADDAYFGTASQNNLLEASLRGGQLGAVTPQPRLLGDNTWTGTNTFSGTTTLASSYVLGNEFGTGADGDVVLSTSTTLTGDKNYNNLTINSGVVLDTGGYKIYVKGTLLNNGTISRNGNNATNGSDATNPSGTNAIAGVKGSAGAALSAGTISGGVAGKDGVDGEAKNGSTGGSTFLCSDNAGVNGQALNPSLGSNGSAGGNGGSDFGYFGDSNTGGAAGSATPESLLFILNGTTTNIITSGVENDFITRLVSGSVSTSTLSSSAGSGSGGKGGCREVAGQTIYWATGGSGGSGSSGGVIFIRAFNIINNGIISANGGNGGNGGNGHKTGGSNQSHTGVAGAGGGAGGAGGVIILVYRNILLGTVTVNGGTKGNGGVGQDGGGAAFSGTNGADGLSGKIYKIKL